jgi:hypothetical protein
VINPYSIAAAILTVVALAGGWRAWLKQAAESRYMDRLLKRAGHIPPETDLERTTWIPIVAAPEDLAYGTHSMSAQSMRLSEYQGEHRVRVGCLSVSALLARESVHG